MFKEMGKYIGAWAFVGLVVYAVWILLGSTPIDRINRSCAFTEWGGRAISNLASLGSDRAESKASEVMSEVTLSCRYFVYRQFYRDEYQKMKEAAEREAS